MCLGGAASFHCNKMERRANSQAKAKVLRFATFWRSVFETLSGILNHKIDPDPLVALFGVIPEELQLPVAKTFLTQFLQCHYPMHMITRTGR